MKRSKLRQVVSGVMTFAVCCVLSQFAAAQAEEFTDLIPGSEPALIEYPVDLGSHVRIYKNYNAWFGFNASEQVLQAPPFNFVLGTDYVVHPMSALQQGIPADTCMIFIPGASNGNSANQITDFNNAAAQANLNAWIQAGGILVIVAGDNGNDDYIVPGLSGPVPEPSNCQGMTINDPTHPFIIGCDGIQGTADDLNNNTIDAQKVGTLGVGACNFCSDTHGNLAGLLPVGATVHITDEGNGNPLFAEYSLGSGQVLVTTRPMEFTCDNPQIIRNWFCYALTLCCDPVEDPDVRTQGFWKRVCAKPHPSGEHESLPTYVDCVNRAATFADVTDVDSLCDRLHPDPKNDKCEQAEAQFMALLLNLCSGRLAECNCVDDPNLGEITVAEAVEFIDSLLSNPNRTFEDCVLAQSIADSINNGLSLVDCP